MELLKSYDARVASGEIKADAGQAKVIGKLGDLARGLEAASSETLFTRLIKSSAPASPKGLYIHGGVGRGKTMLMDMFCGDVRIEAKRRVHFHAFMQDVHERLHGARRKPRDAIAPVAASLASEARLLCLDEMQVSDIADAMILGRLFEALLSHGTAIVTTSNMAPEQLYRDGLNRQLFLPFIELLRKKLDVVELEGDTDYRLGRIKGHETFITPLGANADERMQQLWRKLTDTEHGKPMEIEILGRKLKVPEAAHACARFSFAGLCEAALGPADYLAIARKFRALFVKNIPVMEPAQRNEAKRFITLIDTLYDAQVRLVASSAALPEHLNRTGSQRLEFARTISRLKEMQSASWWGKKIVET